LNFNDDLENLKTYINEHDYFLVIGHESPDGDAIGSALALTFFLRRLGKTAIPCSSGPFTKPESVKYERFFEKNIPLLVPAQLNKAAILVDCSALSRTGYQALPSDFRIIDHHAIVEEDAGYGYTDSSSPSTSLLVGRLIKAFGMTPTAEEAHFLLFGFCTDTGFFRHLTAEGASYIREAADFVEAGASPQVIYDEMQGTFNLQSRHYLGRLLEKAEPYFEGQVLVVMESQHEREEFGGSVVRDTDTVYRLLLSVEGTDTVVILKEDERGVSGGLRSSGKVDVAAVAAAFGGGGHRKASGFLAKESLLRVRDLVLKEIKPFLI
jgi:phosphoesterase RecJ-like protein